jgi:REP element-mobilizing transposase RayT
MTNYTRNEGVSPSTVKPKGETPNTVYLALGRKAAWDRSEAVSASLTEAEGETPSVRPYLPSYLRYDLEIERRVSRKLPHWRQTGGTYAVTFHLGDSVPAATRRAWEMEREQLLSVSEANGTLPADARQRLAELHQEHIQTALDAGIGACHLKNPAMAEVVAKALRHFDGERYELLAWCIMPNHVHAIVKPLGQHELEDIMHTWKSYTAHVAKRQLGLDDRFWEPEYYDHLIRDDEDFVNQLRYIVNNPEKAGLTEWPWLDWNIDSHWIGRSSRSEGVSPSLTEAEGETPSVRPTAESKDGAKLTVLGETPSVRSRLLAIVLLATSASAQTVTFETPADLTAFTSTVTSNSTLIQSATVGAGNPVTGGLRYQGNTSNTDRGSVSYKTVAAAPSTIGTWQQSVLVNFREANDSDPNADKGELRIGFTTGTSVNASKPWEFFNKNNVSIHLVLKGEHKPADSKFSQIAAEMSSAAVVGTEVKSATVFVNDAVSFEHWLRATFTVQRTGASTFIATFLVESLGADGTAAPVTVIQSASPFVVTNAAFGNAATHYEGFAFKTEKLKTTSIYLDDFHSSAVGSAPGVPTATAATSVNSGGFTANWTPGSGPVAADYTVQVSTQANNFSTFTTHTATGTSVAITGLTALETYVYRVIANNTIGSSAASNVISLTLPNSNAPPSMDAIANIGPLATYAPATNVNLVNISAGGEAGQTVTITASSSDPSVVPHPTISYTAPATTGTLTFDPAGIPGSATITVTLNDGQAENHTTTVTFTITVSDPPINVAFENATDSTTFFNIVSSNLTTTHTSNGGANGTGGLAMQIATAGSDSGYLAIRNQTYPLSNATEIVSSLKFNLRELDNVATGQERKAELRVGISPTNSTSGKPDEYFNKSNHGLSIKVKGEHKTGTTRNIECELENFNGAENKAGKITLPTASEFDDWLEVRLSIIPLGSNNFRTSYTLFTLGINGSDSPTAIMQSTPVVFTNASLAAVANVFAGYTVKIDKKNTATEGVFIDDHSVIISTDPASTPTALAADRITAASFNANWTPGTGAYSASYIVQVVQGMNDFLPGNFVANQSTTATTLRIPSLSAATAYRYRVIGVNLNGQSAPSAVVDVTTLAAGINAPPTMDLITDPAPLAVNASLQTIPMTGISDGGELTQNISITATSSNPGLIPHPAVTYTSPGTTGSLSFTPTADTVGNSTITVTVNDGAGNNNLTTRTFTIIVVSPPALIDFNDPNDLTTKLGRYTDAGTTVTAENSAVTVQGLTAGVDEVFLGIRPTAYDATSAGYLVTSMLVNFGETLNTAGKDGGELRLGFMANNTPNLSKLNDTLTKTAGNAALGMKFKVEHSVTEPDKQRILEAELFSGPNDTKTGKTGLINQDANRWYKVTLYIVRLGLSGYGLTYFVQDYGIDGDTPGPVVLSDGPYTYTSAAFATDTSVFAAFSIKGAKEGETAHKLYFDDHEAIVNTTAPFAPTTENPLSGDFDFADLAWTPSALGRTPTSYLVEVVQGNATFTQGNFLSQTGVTGQTAGFSVAAPALNGTLSGLQALTTYRYRVMAAIGADTSAAKNIISFTTPDSPLLIGPNDVVVRSGFLNRSVYVTGDVGEPATLLPDNSAQTSGIVSVSIGETLHLDAHSRVLFTLGQSRHTKLIVNDLAPVHPSTVFEVQIGGLTPQEGAQFDLIDWTTRATTGDLDWSDNLVLPTLTGSLTWDTSLFTSQGIIRINGTPTALAISDEPDALAVLPGANATFSVAVTGTAPWLFQWMKNGQDIPAESNSSLQLTNVNESHDALYSVRITNGQTTATSTAVRLNVYDPPLIVTPPSALTLNPTQTATFTVAATTEVGTLSYEWRFNGNPISGGPNAPTLTLVGITEASQGNYTVAITNPAGTTLSTAAALNVNDPIRILTHPLSQTVSNGNTATFSVVADGTAPFTYQWQRNGVDLAGETASTLSLTANPNTVGRYRVKVSNVAGFTYSNAATLTLGGWFVGAFEAPLPRHSVLNANLGGVLRVTTTADFTYTGKITLGTVSYSIKGNLVFNPADPMRPTLSVTVPRKNTTALTLSIAFGPDAMESISLTDGTATLSAIGWRKVWNKTVLPTAYAGYYTLGMDTPLSLVQTRPEGTSYGSFTVSPTLGTLTFTGKLSDGTAYSSAAFVGPHGEVCVFAPLYKSKGSIVGSLQIAAAAQNKDNTLVGEVSWLRPAITGKVFPAGFGPFDLSAVGSRYDAPAASTIVMGLTPGVVNNARIEFSTLSTLPVRIDLKHKVIPDAALKPAKFTATLNPKTGLLTGSYSLSNPTRTVTFSALILRDATGQSGRGYLLVPDGATTKSAQVIFEPLP